LEWSPDDGACLRFLERLRRREGFACRCGADDGGWWQIAEAADSGLDSIATPIYDRQDRLPEQKPGRVKNTTLFEPPKTLAQLRVCLDSLGDEPALPPVAAELIQAVGLWLIQSGA
jgi:hypothetical protein